MQRHAQFRLAHAANFSAWRTTERAASKRDVAAANDDDFAAKRHPVTQVDVQQEFNCPQYSVELHALDGQLAALVRADPQKHRFVALFLQVRKGNVLAKPPVAPNLHAERLNGLDFRLDDFARQPVFRHAQHQHAAGQVLRLEYRRGKSPQRQFVRAGHPRPRADDGDFPSSADAFAARITQLGKDAARSKSSDSTPNFSQTNRFSARIEIGASSAPRRHLASQGAAQTRPQMEAKGFWVRAMM